MSCVLLPLPSADAVSALLESAHRKAAELGIEVAIAVVDAGGTLAGFLRMPGAFLLSSDLAVDKAWTAAGMRVPTRKLGDMLASLDRSVNDGLLRRPRVTVVPGGMPLECESRCIGAIGVSGGSAEQDEEIAAAAIAALMEKIG